MFKTDKEALQELQGTAGLRYIQFIVKEKMDKLKSVMEIDPTICDPGIQAMGKKYAVTVLNDLLNDLTLIEPTKFVKRDNTYD